MFWYWTIVTLYESLKIFEFPISLKYNYLYDVFKKYIKGKNDWEKNILFYKFLIVFECMCLEQNMSYFNKKVYFNMDKKYFFIDQVTDLLFIKKVTYSPTTSSFYFYYREIINNWYKKKYQKIETELHVSEESIEKKYQYFIQKYQNMDRIIKYKETQTPKRLILNRESFRLNLSFRGYWLARLKIVIDFLIFIFIFLLCVLLVNTIFNSNFFIQDTIIDLIGITITICVVILFSYIIYKKMQKYSKNVSNYEKKFLSLLTDSAVKPISHTTKIKSKTTKNKTKKKVVTHSKQNRIAILFLYIITSVLCFSILENIFVGLIDLKYIIYMFIIYDIVFFGLKSKLKITDTNKINPYVKVFLMLSVIIITWRPIIAIAGRNDFRNILHMSCYVILYLVFIETLNNNVFSLQQIKQIFS